MVWGGICGQQQTDRIVTDGNLTAHRYINQVLCPVLLHSCNTNRSMSYIKLHISPLVLLLTVINYHFMGFIEYTHVYL